MAEEQTGWDQPPLVLNDSLTPLVYKLIQLLGVINVHSRFKMLCLGLGLRLWLRLEEGNVIFNDALNTFYLRLYGIRHRTTQIVIDETCCCHIGYSFQLAARLLLYASFHRQDNSYHSLCYISHGALAGMRNSSVGHKITANLLLLLLLLLL